MMYTRNFSRDDEGISIPQNYDGTSLLYDGSQREEKSEECPKIEENKEYTPSWLDKIGIKSYFPRLDEIFKKGFKLGTEEIIIIALIVFLIFSKSADIESILILIALLFI